MKACSSGVSHMDKKLYINLCSVKLGKNSVLIFVDEFNDVSFFHCSKGPKFKLWMRIGAV